MQLGEPDKVIEVPEPEPVRLPEPEKAPERQPVPGLAGSIPLMMDYHLGKFRTEGLPSQRRDMPVVGWRMWKLDWPNKQLRSTWWQYVWTPGKNAASCDHMESTIWPGRSPEKPRIPHDKCPAGIHARQFPVSFPRLGYVIGAVLLTGRVVHHSAHEGYAGWRAEKGQIIALVGSKDDMTERLTVPKIAEVYQVPVVSTMQGLYRLALEFGDAA